MSAAYKKNVVIFISGTGSNMHALIKASEQLDYPARIVGIISDQEAAKGLEIAESYGIKTYFINPKACGSKASYENTLNETLVQLGTDIICLAGFMYILSAEFCTLWDGKMINIHPSLLPAFKGLNTHQRAIDIGVKFTGCTIHYVSAEMDAGKIIAQAVVPVYKEDTVDILSKRVLSAEHILYPKTLQALCDTDISYDRQSFYHAG